MINGTKLLNVAGMTRGRRDGILKSEKTRHVVKIGPMHLKGVWYVSCYNSPPGGTSVLTASRIPFDRALDFANKEKITEQLYPLFVHNIGALLYHPQNTGRQSIGGTTAIATGDRRRPDGHSDYMRTPQSTQAPPLGHHHSMAHPAAGHLPQPPHSGAPHPSSGRPALDRAHTFPTPPTSASSMMGISHSGGNYESWGNAGPSAVQQGPLTIDTSQSNARPVPQTPATTPPGTSMSSMPSYQTTQAYENSRHMYTGTSQQGGYAPQSGMPRYAPVQPVSYVKNEMAPPSRAGVENDINGDHKSQDDYASQPHHGVDDPEGEHESEYTHSAGPYTGSRVSYAYGPHATPTSLHGDQSHMASDSTGSPHQKPSGGATPRTTTASYNGYSTPQRTQHSSSLYSVMGDNRNAANGADMYGQNAYTAPYPNGLPPPNKRVRELDDVDDSYNGPEDNEGLKRRRTIREDSAGRARPVAAQKKR